MGISINGLASGLDTGLMIEKLMMLEKIPYTNLEQKKSDFSAFQSYFRNLNTKLSTLRDKASDLTFNASFKLTSTKSSDEQAVKAVGSDNAVTGNYQVTVDKLAKSHVIKATEFGEKGDSSALENETITFTQPDGSTVDVTLKGKTYGEMLENLKNDINKNSKTVSASLVETSPGNKTLVLTSVKTGVENKFHTGGGSSGIGITGSGSILNDLGLVSGGNFQEVQAAQDAELKVNGLSVKSSSNEVKGVIDGVTLQLQKESSSAMITVGQDSEKVIEKVKGFVDAFNEVRKLIREGMAKPEEKPKDDKTPYRKTTLQGDSTLRQLDMELGSWMSSNIAGLGTLSELGIEIDKDKKGAEMTGQIVFDEKKFKEALERDPDKVISMFNMDETDAAGNKKQGIATILNDELPAWTSKANGILQSRVNGYDSEISFITESMSKMEDRLTLKEQQLKRQFTAMEVALSKLKNEQSWMTSQINSLSKSSS
ncbi:flagellar filament capping protein FliD [Paenibacillus apiarius]|uniref:Flagellar hook-associated protein 2 n=1 Tax=Paenibacillus apiarius TaxID=46240 RepID=A0ABT4DSJ1_9BACL|nr:flagellar filament capping protein FliD [Paenibacillus apiarius]MCY9514186.1 flagellar filament capping protein FliD [Paenibacillus apiarius]MCY9520309.1 flagellar filament capping protein FliD [Paenibacillus apiarius]MCY9557411.1 flagellar filament capping protein FliD [Paenibacillus apiarius]MCY9682410.1 flagellar filament capping protein FliD [Paenibacillus apiarius]MCY9723782.1 flagellar filament capping protein FliD [Paenibacillus apiarius]